MVNREQGGKESLEKMGFKVDSLVKISEVVGSLHKSGAISKEQMNEVLDYI